VAYPGYFCHKIAKLIKLLVYLVFYRFQNAICAHWKRKNTNENVLHLLISPSTPNNPVKWKQWTENQINMAIDVGKSGVNHAVQDHGISATTLKDRTSGRVKENSCSGPSRYLVENEENELGMFVPVLVMVKKL